MVTKQRRLKGAERRKQVLELAQAGYSFRQIGAQLGISHGAAYEHFRNALAEVVRPVAEETLNLELERLDTMQQPLWPSASRGNLKSQAAVLRLMERRAAYLGLDAPKRLAGADGGPLEIAIVDARERLLNEVNERRERLRALPPVEREDQSV
jgi:AcrR family transcriptional regulator